MSLTKSELAKYMDHTLLKADATAEQIDRVVAEARELNTASVCVNGYWVPRVAAALEGTDVMTCAVIGFPLGAMSTAAKAAETADAVSYTHLDVYKRQGKTIIVITHKLKEIKASSNTCTIIRRGQYVDEVTVADVTEENLADMMVGHHVNLQVEKQPATPGKTVFEIRDLHVNDERGIETVKGLDLAVRSGEIVGIAGIDGNGQKELVEAITCLTKATSGKILVNGEEIQNTTPRNVIDHKVSTIHEDRQKRGLVLPFTVAENAVLEKYRTPEFGKHGMLDGAKMHEYTEQLIADYDVRPADCADKTAGGLSGGNQQKVIIAREVSNDPDVLIAVQPTRGLDVGAIEYVHKALVAERDRGTAILLISLELDEVMSVSDIIDVIYDGRITGTFKQGEVDENKIGLLMAGGE